jgi:hypothetical protein
MNRTGTGTIGALKLVGSAICAVVFGWAMAVGAGAQPFLTTEVTVGAADVTIVDLNPGINFTSVGPATVTADSFNETYAAQAQAGFLGLRTSASFSEQVKAPGVGGGDVFAYAFSGDILTPAGGTPGSPGSAVFDFLVSGSNGALLSGVGGVVGSSVGVSYSALLACDGSANFGCDVEEGPPAASFMSTSYSDVPVEISLPIIYGQPVEVEFELFSHTGYASAPGLLVSFGGFSNFFDTVTLQSVQLLDGNGNPVSDPQLIAESGTNYPLGTPPSTAPEPSTALLLALALAALGAMPIGSGRRPESRRRNSAPSIP